MEYFSRNGRRVPGKDDRIFGSEPSSYYKINQPAIEYKVLLERGKWFNNVPECITEAECKSAAESLLEKIRISDAFANLLNGVKIPFVTMRRSQDADFGQELERDLLPALQNSFVSANPGSHFRAILQGKSKLAGSVALDSRSRYQEFIFSATASPVVGWYFPQALQEFDTYSQRNQMSSLPELPGAKFCLSGGIDICAAITGFPNLLISDKFYAPILCMSAYKHDDPRMVLLLKAYGPNLEFWCMTQMLTKQTLQVSEQWAGGITVYGRLTR